MKPTIQPYDEDAVDGDEEQAREVNGNGDADAEANKNEPAVAESVEEPQEEKSKEPEKPMMKCEVKEFEARYNLQGKLIVKEAGSQPEPEVEEAAKEETPEFVMQAYKHYARDGSMESTRIEIYSPHIQNALREVIVKYPGQSFKGKTIYLSGESVGEALSCIFHYRQELEAYAQKLSTPEEKMHVLMAVKYMRKELGRALRMYEALTMETDDPGIFYGDLWMLFKPGDLAFTGSGQTESVFIVKGAVALSDGGLFDPGPRFQVSLKYLSHNEKDFGYRNESITIRPYKGAKSLTSLAVFPFQYHPQKSAKRAALVERGKKFCSLKGVHYRYYEGGALAIERSRSVGFFGWNDGSSEEAIQIKGRVMVDCGGFEEYVTSTGITLQEIKNVQFEDLSDDDFILSNYQVPGFSMTEKRWCWFMVDSIQDISFDDDAFDKLILPTGQKRLVRALTKQHIWGEDNFDDVIKSKGKGCIFLLHGPPGVGKTATAEGIADDLRRPIYVVMSGDMGTSLDTIESRFRTVLKLVRRWDAILLMDEADVFLEKRATHDLSRNGLVTILLRLFEYFDGIMFMTTNRVDTIDMAFQSRIHLTLGYKSLDAKARLGLWRLFLERTACYEAEAWPDDVLRRLAEVKLNGRQIKNAVRTANSLALSEKHLLSVVDIDVVLDTIAEADGVFEPESGGL